jgi:hypothetical protein
MLVVQKIDPELYKGFCVFLSEGEADHQGVALAEDGARIATDQKLLVTPSSAIPSQTSTDSDEVTNQTFPTFESFRLELRPRDLAQVQNVERPFSVHLASSDFDLAILTGKSSVQFGIYDRTGVCYSLEFGSFLREMQTDPNIKRWQEESQCTAEQLTRALTLSWAWKTDCEGEALKGLSLGEVKIQELAISCRGDVNRTIQAVQKQVVADWCKGRAKEAGRSQIEEEDLVAARTSPNLAARQKSLGSQLVSSLINCLGYCAAIRDPLLCAPPEVRANLLEITGLDLTALPSIEACFGVAFMPAPHLKELREEVFDYLYAQVDTSGATLISPQEQVLLSPSKIEQLKFYRLLAHLGYDLDSTPEPGTPCSRSPFIDILHVATQEEQQTANEVYLFLTTQKGQDFDEPDDDFAGKSIITRALSLKGC